MPCADEGFLEVWGGSAHVEEKVVYMSLAWIHTFKNSALSYLFHSLDCFLWELLAFLLSVCSKTTMHKHVSAPQEFLSLVFFT